MASISAFGLSALKARRDGLEAFGDQLLFYIKALAWTPRAVRRYRREILNTLAEVTFGAGGLTVIAGTVGVIAFLSFFAGTEVGIQGYASLSQIGVAKFSAFISAYFNTREVAPLVSSIALAATVGCGYTARLGAMRISEEIDALEVMGVYLTFKLTGFKVWKLTKSLQISNLLFTIFCENFEMKVATAMPNFNLL